MCGGFQRLRLKAAWWQTLAAADQSKANIITEVSVTVYTPRAVEGTLEKLAFKSFPQP